MNNIKMLFYDRIDVSEGTDVGHHWFFFNKTLKFQPYVCNRCHDLLIMSMKLSNITLLEIKNADYCCIFSSISKSEAINLMQNINLTENSWTL